MQVMVKQAQIQHMHQLIQLVAQVKLYEAQKAVLAE